MATVEARRKEEGDTTNCLSFLKRKKGKEAIKVPPQILDISKNRLERALA